MTRTRLTGAVTLVYGAALLVRPKQVLVAVGTTPADQSRALVGVTRFLGARYVVQGMAVARDGRFARLASWADGLHAASMLPLLGSRRYRRPAAVSAAAAATLAVVARSGA